MKTLLVIAACFYGWENRGSGSPGRRGLLPVQRLEPRCVGREASAVPWRGGGEAGKRSIRGPGTAALDTQPLSRVSRVRSWLGWGAAVPDWEAPSAADRASGHAFALPGFPGSQHCASGQDGKDECQLHAHSLAAAARDFLIIWWWFLLDRAVA